MSSSGGKKRGAERPSGSGREAKSSGQAAGGLRPDLDAAASERKGGAESGRELAFEDPFGDEFESENLVLPPKEGEAAATHDPAAGADVPMAPPSSSAASRSALEVARAAGKGAPEELVHDPSAYDMLHKLNLEWPCLSFHFLTDKLGYLRKKFPHTMYVIAGSQAASGQRNKLFIAKASDLARTKHDMEDAEEESDEDMADSDPILEHREVRHPGGVNRIRSMEQHPNIVATWSAASEVHIWDLKDHIKALDEPPTKRLAQKPLLQSLTKHKEEGFALDWSPLKEGRLLTGDCNNTTYLWEPKEGGRWSCSAPFLGHGDSVEDLQWSPTQPNVFASCSADKTVRFWDCRQQKRSQITVKAHATDVNVISWNRKVTYLVISGGDDGIFKIWDLRSLAKPAAEFKWHRGPITSVEWSPHEDSVLAVSSEDNTLSIWDLAVEKDEGTATTVEDDIPPQLLFIHEGQKDIKELHWHSQVPGSLGSTARDGLNLFKPANID